MRKAIELAGTWRIYPTGEPLKFMGLSVGAVKARSVHGRKRKLRKDVARVYVESTRMYGTAGAFLTSRVGQVSMDLSHVRRDLRPLSFYPPFLIGARTLRDFLDHRLFFPHSLPRWSPPFLHWPPLAYERAPAGLREIVFFTRWQQSPNSRHLGISPEFSPPRRA